MQFFIGIVPPPSLSGLIAAIQKPYGDNRTEPHITLRPPVLLLDKDKWLQAIRDEASNTRKFPVSLTGTGTLGKRVLFIEAVSPGLYKLEISLRQLRKYEQPSKRDEQSYHPHLTLGRLNVGFTPQSLSEMRKLADELLASPVEFEVRFIRVYYQPSIRERYKVYEDIALM